MFILIITRKYKLLFIFIQQKLIATVPKQGCCSSYCFLLWTTSGFFLCQSSRPINYFYRTTLPNKKKKRQQGKEMPWMITSTALLKTWAALCLQSPNIPYKWIFYSCIPWDRGSYCFCKWEMKQWLIPRGLVRAHTWNAFCCRVVWQD